MINLRGGFSKSRVQSHTNLLMLVIAGLFVFMQFIALSQPIQAQAEQVNPDKVWICHATDSVQNPYQRLHVPHSAIDGEGENDHTHHEGPIFDPDFHHQQNRGWGDIIPSLHEEDPGYNWTEDGRDIWEQNCGDEFEEPCEEGPGWAAYVVDYNQGTQLDGDPIGEDRSDPNHVVGEPDVNPPTVDGFFSLGFPPPVVIDLRDDVVQPVVQDEVRAGWMVLGFNGYVVDVEGPDLSFHEATFGNRYAYGEEVANVSVSQNGVDWYELGPVSNHDDDGGNGVALLDFTDTGLDWVKYVRLVDQTDPSEHNGNGDGYDLDAVDASFVACDDLEPCTVELYSDTSTMVEETEDYAEALSFVHPAWTASIDGATWIWGDDPVVDPTVDETQTFVRTFGWNGPVDSAVLDVASDNYYDVYLNGSHVGGDAALNNFQLATQDSYDLSPYVVTGENTLVIEVTNHGVDGSSARSNPAGLLYSAVIEGSDEDCGEPPEPETFTIHVDKVVCRAERYLPNWGARGVGPDIITNNTAERWVNASEENCRLAEWGFQWAPQTSNPGDHVGTAGEPWEGFHDSVEIPLEDLGDANRVWVREVFVEGYVPFSGANQSEDESAELYCYRDIVNYDNFDFIQSPEAGETYYCVAFNAPLLGQISGLVYNDLSNDANQDGNEPVLDGWDVWLLTRNSPFTVQGIFTTLDDGSFLFDDLPLGTYYVCQDIPEGWTQTELNFAGNNGVDSSAPNVGDVLDLDDSEVGEYCYLVELTQDNPIALNRDFGNFQTVLGQNEVTDDDGAVLGVTTEGEVLGETGSAAIVSVLTGILLILMPAALTRTSRQ